MIELERHIEILLLSNDCVIVPGLGGFMAHHVEATFDASDCTFLPPLRTLGFNPKLTMNDSLLVQSYVEAYDLSYPEAERRIESEVTELRQHLENEGSYELNDIGLLALNEDGNLVFTPCEAGILTPALYGLSSFEMIPLAAAESKKEASTTKKPSDRTATAKAEEPQDTESALEKHLFDEDDEDEHTIKIKMSWVRNAVAVAAAVVAFFVMTTPVSNSRETGRSMGNLHNPMLSGMTVKDTNMQKVTISTTTDTAAIAAVAPEEQKADTAKAVTPTPVTTTPEKEAKEESYTIVLASYITKKNANAFVEKLHSKGFDQARVFVRNNVTRVILGNYSSESNAHDHLRTLRGDKDFDEAWVMGI